MAVIPEQLLQARLFKQLTDNLKGMLKITLIPCRMLFCYLNHIVKGYDTGWQDALYNYDIYKIYLINIVI